MMANIFKSSDKSATMMALCAAAMNEVIGKRDYSDTEVSHLLNDLPIVEYSHPFSRVFSMDVRRSFTPMPKEGETVDPTSVAVQSSIEEWYTHRYPDLENLCAYQLLQEVNGSNYAQVDPLVSGPCKFIPIFSPFHECSLPPREVDQAQDNNEIEKLLKKSELYAEQRLVMFKPFRVRSEDLRGNAATWMEALEAWLQSAPTSGNQFTIKTAAAVQYELSSYRLRQEAIDAMAAEQMEPETPEGSGEEDDDETGEDDDPLMLLSRLYPEAQIDVEAQAELHTAKDWTTSIRPLQVFDEETSKLPWITLQRELLGDEMDPDYSKYDAEHLKEYPEQFFAFEIVRNHATRLFQGDDVEALLMIIDGAGGCGKSHVLHCAVKEIKRLAALSNHEGIPVRIIAPTGSAASLVFGGTLHSFIRYNPSRQFAEFVKNSESETQWQEFVAGLKYIFIDERSLLSEDLLAKLLSRLQQGFPSQRGNSQNPTCGVSIVLFGDDFQLPPTNGGRLYADPSYTFQGKKGFSKEREKARRVYVHHFQTCVQLVTNVRAKGASPEQAKFRAFQMECLRPCLPTASWYECT
eukprot:898287-Prymnesium_polylepis.2